MKWSELDLGVVGLGLDIVAVARISELWRRYSERFVARLLSETERQQFDDANLLTAERLAGRWAAKEAVSKALGSGFRGFNMNDIEILNDSLGRPQVFLRNGAAERALHCGIETLLLSISHERDYAVAEALALGFRTRVETQELQNNSKSPKISEKFKKEE